MLKAITRDEAELHEFPGRRWYHYSGPAITGARHVTLGYTVLPAGNVADGHVHPAEEESIYVVSGRGELVSPEGTVALEPGTAVFVPSGLRHEVFSHGPGDLELVTAFGPPVVPGSYVAED